MKFFSLPRLVSPLAIILGVLLAFAGAPEASAKGRAETTRKASKAKLKKAKRTKASKKKRARKRKRRAKRRSRGRLVCKKRRGKKRCRRVPHFRGHGVAKSRLRTEPLKKPSGDIHIYSVNFREDIKVNIYNSDGSFNEQSLAALDHGFRCKRTREERAVDPKLYELLSSAYDHFGKKRIELVSGFRFQRNEGSRHYHASAMDFRIPGVSSRKLYKYAESLDGGNLGIGRYPTSGFIHIDVRAPGEKSYRWTDTSRPGSNSKGKRPSRRWRRKPNT